jgi:hypothetical protein
VRTGIDQGNGEKEQRKWAVSQSAVDYAGRTIDVLAFQGVQPSGNALLTAALALPGQGGFICTGTQKLAQRWVLEFLTVQGTLLFLPTRGCEFLTLLLTGQLRTTLDAEQAFYLSAQQIKVNLQAEENSTDPDDERLDSVNLLSLILSLDSLQLSVNVVSLAGTSRKVILPLPVNIRN